jgi:hypothetical protein
LSIPPLGSLGPKTGEDDVTRQLRPLIGGFQLLELGGQASAIHSVAFPFESTPNSIQATGTPVTVAGKGSVSLVSLEAADPADYEVRNRGWKLITLSLQYAAQDSQSARASARRAGSSAKTEWSTRVMRRPLATSVARSARQILAR